MIYINDIYKLSIQQEIKLEEIKYFVSFAHQKKVD